MANPKNVEDVYRLSGVQESVLAHGLHGGPGAGVLAVQAMVHGPLDVDGFARAWQETVDHHPVLRSSVHWRDLAHPVQVVARSATLEIEQLGPLGTSPAEAEAALASWTAAQKHRGLTLERAPVMRVALSPAGEARHRLVWLAHHLLLDGWSSALVLRDVVERYGALLGRDGQGVAAAASFHAYVRWARADADDAARSFFRRRTGGGAGLLGTPALVEASWHGGARPTAARSRTVAGIDVRALEAWARARQVTAGTVLLGCWAWLLAERSESERVVFGSTVSGRAASFAGVENVVGMLSNTLPLALDVDRDQPIDEALSALQAAQRQLEAVGHVPLDRLLAAGGVTLRRPPFDTLVAIANFPGFETPSGGHEGGREVRIRDVRGDVTSGLPLALAIVVEREIRLEARFDPAHVPAGRVAALLRRFEALLAAVVGTGDTAAPNVGVLLDALPADRSADLSSTTDETPVPVTQPVPVAEPVPEPVAASRSETGASSSADREGDPVENQMMRIWNDLIEIRDLSRDDPFFAVGGHSLLVPSLLLRIEQDFGVRLPMGALYAAPSIRQLAEAVRQKRDADAGSTAVTWPSLVPIRKDGDASPLFMVHGLGGEVGWFYGLADHLAARVPLYGLQAPGEPFDDLVAMAKHYVSRMRELLPRGPYRLGGYCVGGGIAYEMAQQLVAVGEEVDVLVLVDSVPQATVAGQGTPPLVRATRRMRHLLSKTPRAMATSIADAARRGGRRLVEKGRQRTNGDGGAVAGPELDDVLDMRTLPPVYHRAARRHFRAMRDYRPVPYPGDVWLFRTADPRFGEDFGWGALVGGALHVTKVPGGHLDVLRPPAVRTVGAVLSEVLVPERLVGAPSTGPDG